MWAGVRPRGVDVGVFGVVKPSESPPAQVFLVVKPSESPSVLVFLVVKPSESPSVLVFGGVKPSESPPFYVFRAVKPSESPPFYVFPVVKPSESPPFYVFHPVIPSVSPILTCGFVLCACLRRWPLPGDSPAGVGPFLGRSAACPCLLAAASVVGCCVVVGVCSVVGSMFVGVVVVGELVSLAWVAGVVGWGGKFVVVAWCRWCWSVVVSWLFDERVLGCLSLNGLWVVVCAFTWACWYIGGSGVVW